MKDMRDMKEMKMNQQHSSCKKKEKENLYKIGMFANMNRVTIKTLRYYDDQKLLVPVYVDEENGYRYYEAGQMAQLHRIIALKNMGFSIEDIRKIVGGAEEKTFLLEKKQDSGEIAFKVFPKVPMAACIFHKGSYNTLHKSYAMLLQYIEENGYEICGNIRESYIDGVWNKETENEWLTEIQIPVKSVETIE